MARRLLLKRRTVAIPSPRAAPSLVGLACSSPEPLHPESVAFLLSWGVDFNQARTRRELHVTLDQLPLDYDVVVSTRFAPANLKAVGTLQYAGATVRAPGPLPAGPPGQFDWSVNQARSFRWKLMASTTRPNPQGSYHYGAILTSRTPVLVSSSPALGGWRWCAVNGVSFVVPNTLLKLTDNNFIYILLIHLGS
ncbi:hypothetical protein C2845_PM15G14500 [Panicum miliaceum]|uniref:Uncharacterized protein n=1 Tax=Panicum miliaceum TaxID=4540 RepID=A0A3L6Q499_PANMI|nr:hypothetical protein C2845_PM15G14500 [Panicum miliaceum]